MDAKIVAKQILFEGKKQGCCDISNLKLQKLLYLSDLVSIGLSGQPIFDDQLEAWPLGPVVPSIYHHYKTFRAKTIDIDAEDSGIFNLKEIASFIIDAFGSKKANKLVDLSHKDPIYNRAKNSGDRILNYCFDDAMNILNNHIANVQQRIALASLKGKLKAERDETIPPYIDDYAGKSDDEMMRYWGINVNA